METTIIGTKISPVAPVRRVLNQLGPAIPSPTLAGERSRYHCVNIGGQPVDVERMAEISGQSINRILSLAEQITATKKPDLPADIALIMTSGKAKAIYEANYCSDRRSSRRMFALARWIELCQTADELAEIGPKISLEVALGLYFLQHVARICPGE